MRLSTGLVSRLMGKVGMQQALSNCLIDIYSGVIPATPDAIPNGSLLCTISLSGGAPTLAVNAQGSVTLTGGSSGSVTTVTVNGVDVLGGSVPYNASTTNTATDVAAKINRNPKNVTVSASASGNVITLTALPGLGALANGWVVTATLTNITASYVDIGTLTAGVDAVNGLQWESPVNSASALQIDKPATATWSCTSAVATGTAGWFRIREATDSGNVSSSTVARIDGTVGTTGADMNLPSLSIVAASPVTVPSGSISLPQL